MVTCLYHGFDVPTSKQIATMQSFLKPGDTSSEQYKTIKYLENLIENPGTLQEKPKPWAERLLTYGDCLCKEAISFEGVDAIFFGIGAQVCFYFFLFFFIFFFFFYFFFIFFLGRPKHRKKLRSDSRSTETCMLFTR